MRLAVDFRRIEIGDSRAQEPREPVRPDEQTPPSQPLPSRRPDSRIPWAELLLRVFREDVLGCPCGGRRVVVAFISERVVTEILEHLGLPTTGPPIAAARTTASDQDPPWQDDVPSVQRSLQ